MTNVLSPEQEAALLQQVASGNAAAFTQLYHVHAVWVEEYLKDISSLSPNDQEDIIQEVFLAVWKKRESLTGISSFKGYLFIITRNRVMNTFTRDSKRRQVFKHLSFSQPYIYDGLEEDLLYRFYVEKVAEAIRLLPDKVQMVFKVSSAHLVTAKQVSQMLKISVHMVRKYIRQANIFIINYLREKAGWLITVISFYFQFIL